MRSFPFFQSEVTPANRRQQSELHRTARTGTDNARCMIALARRYSHRNLCLSPFSIFRKQCQAQWIDLLCRPAYPQRRIRRRKSRMQPAWRHR